LAGAIRIKAQNTSGYGISEKFYIIILLSCKTMDIRWEECEKLAAWVNKTILNT